MSGNSPPPRRPRTPARRHIPTKNPDQTQEAWVYSHAGPIRRRKRRYILTPDQSDAGSAGIFSRRTHQTQEAQVYSHAGPDAGSADARNTGIFSRRTNQTQEAQVYSHAGPDAGSAGIFSRRTNQTDLLLPLLLRLGRTQLRGAVRPADEKRDNKRVSARIVRVVVPHRRPTVCTLPGTTTTRARGSRAQRGVPVRECESRASE
eukprot:1196010-Prorocentrum_minimum.AAC.1